MNYLQRAIQLLVFTALTACQSTDWSLNVPREIPTPVNAIAVSPDGSHAAVVGGVFHGLLQEPDPGFAFVVDLNSGSMERQLPNQGDGVSSVVFMDNGNRAVAGSYDTSILLADLSGDHQTRTAWPVNGVITAMATPPGGAYFAAAGWLPRKNETQSVHIMLCDRSAQPFRRYALGDSPVVRMAFSPDGQTLAICNIDREVILLDLPTGQLRALRQAIGGSDPLAVEFSDNGKLFIGGGFFGRRHEGGWIESWNPDLGRMEHQAHCDAPVRSISCCAPANLVAAAASGARFFTRDLVSLPSSTEIPDNTNVVKLIAGGSALLYGSSTGVFGSATVRDINPLQTKLEK